MTKNILIGLAALGLVTACGGGGGASAPETGQTGILSIAITDAAVENVDVVNVRFTGVTLKPQSGESMEFVFDTPLDIDLLTLQNGNTAELLGDTVVPVGPYNWIRLAVEAEFDNVFDSYAILSDTQEQVELRVPSGSQSGLKLVSGFTVTADQSTNIVVDWDLRMALTAPQGQPGLFLRPALRVTDMSSYGTLEGTVDSALVEDADCNNDLVAGTGNAVYLYPGEVLDPLDIRGAETDPVVTATVSKDSEEVYRYSVTYLSAGEYTAAFTCDAALDEPDTEDEIVLAPVLTGIVISEGVTTTVDFEAPSS